MEGLVMPSKVYGILAAGRPVVFIGEPKSELAALIEREQVGFAVGLGDGAGLAQQILALTRDLPRLKRYGINARKWFEREFTRAQAKARWRELLHAASAASASLAEP
jgi:glycosyltransferase involved in cell wall biosynthesis